MIDVFSRAAGTYDSVGPRHFSYFAGELVEFAAVGPGSRVLDVATGTGAVLLAVADCLGGTGRLVGIDASAAMLGRAAREVRARSSRGVELRLMDAHELDFADSCFDYVLCSFAFLAFQDKGRVLDEFARVLAPGGSVCLLDAYAWFFQHDPHWTWLEEVLRAFGGLPERDRPRTDRDTSRRRSRPAASTLSPRASAPANWCLATRKSSGAGCGPTVLAGSLSQCHRTGSRTSGKPCAVGLPPVAKQTG